MVLRGELRVETREGVHRATAGQAIIVAAVSVRYSTPEGAEYVGSACRDSPLIPFIDPA